MKSNIKKWGIGVFVLAIICLVTSFCLLATTNEKNLILADSTISDEQKVNRNTEVPEISETIELDGADLTTQSAKWSTAVTSALTGKHVLVKLINDWKASNGGFVTADVTGFLNKIIHIPTGATITLDLNGKTINRWLQIYSENGGIFIVNGTLIIKDSAYDGETIINAYNNESFQGRYDFHYLSCGKIVGGRNFGEGGAIKVTNGNFIMEGGMLINNRANASGGAIYASNSNVVINHGVFYNNIAEGRSGMAGGGAICIEKETHFDFYNGIMNKNSATQLGADDGGAVAMWDGECNIYGGIFSNNSAEDSGGVIVSRNGVVNIFGGKYEYNKAIGGGCFYFSQDTKSARISNAYIANNSVTSHSSAILGSINNKQNSKLYISDTIIKDNFSRLYPGAIGRYFDLTLGKNVQIYDNYIKDKPGDICLELGARIKCSEDLGDSKIGITISSDYTGGDVFASDYTTYNGKEPYNYFFSNQYASIATTKESGVVFDKTISGGSYDFVYLDGGKRVNYKDTDYIHTTNDFELRKNVNGGQMVLGSIACGTSVNSFLKNLNFAGNRIKLYDNQNNVIYDYSNSQTGYNYLYDDGVNLAIGTGWYLEVYSQTNSIVEKVYLSVLGDVTGDGKVNAADVNYIRKLISDPTIYASLNDKPYIQLSALIINNGKLTNADGEILWNIVCGKMSIQDFI